MTIQDLGSIGELLAAIGTLITLLYLAIQLRQNTRALNASTFQNISSEMGRNVEPMLINNELSNAVASVQDGEDELDAGKSMQVSMMYLSSLRKLESIFVQVELGSIKRDYISGFEASLVSSLRTEFGSRWWESSKSLFYEPFSTHVDGLLANTEIPDGNPALLTRIGSA